MKALPPDLIRPGCLDMSKNLHSIDSDRRANLQKLHNIEPPLTALVL